MNNNELQIESLKNFILKVAGKQLNKTITNAVVEGIVTKVNENNSTYEVQPKNSNAAAAITATSLNDAIYQVNDLVYMISYEGNLSTVYHIFGSVKSVAEDFINLSLEDRFEADSQFWWDNENGALLSELITGVDKIKQEGCFKIEGKFKTLEGIEQESNYGLQIELLSNDNYSTDNIINTYYLNPPYFLGQPYNLNGNITQSRIVTLTEDEANKLKAIKVSTFGENFEYRDLKLSCGTLLNIEGTLNVLTTIENNKDYVSSRNLNDKAVVSVKVNYDGQELNSTLLSYYWLLKDENVKDENDYGYLAAAGVGWRCLNSFEEVSILGVDTKLRFWRDESRTFELFPNGTTVEGYVQLPHYENTLKCLVQFKDLAAESREFTIYNYDKEQFSATLVSNVEPASIISKTDFITLTCDLKNENKKWNESDSSYEYIYTWYKEDDDSEDGWVNITPKEVNGTDINTNVLTIYGAESDKKVETSYIVTDNAENIYCKVTINKNGAIVSTEETNKKTVTSYIGLESTIKKETFYKYYISTNMNVNFIQMVSEEEGEGLGTEWNGDWEIDDSSVGEGENPNWENKKDDGTELKENDGYNVVFKDTSIVNPSFNINDDLYVYYTQKDVWTQEKMGESELIREENWATPLIARGLDYDASKGGWYNSKEGAAAEKINTFNKLTNNGTLEGIQFDGDEAYINATYINTGVLRVGEENEEVFLATIEKNSEGKNPVKIAGFYVDKNSIHSNNGSINISSDNSDNNNLAIAVGGWLKFTIQDISELQLFYKIDESGGTPAYGKEEADNNILNTGFQDGTPIITFTYDDPDSPQDKNVDTYIYNGNYEYESTIYDRWDGIGEQEGRFILTNIIVEKSSKFSVNHAGQLKAEDADIKGKIIAEEGEIGGFEITESSIKNDLSLFELSNDPNKPALKIGFSENRAKFLDIYNKEGADISDYIYYYSTNKFSGSDYELLSKENQDYNIQGQVTLKEGPGCWIVSRISNNSGTQAFDWLKYQARVSYNNNIWDKWIDPNRPDCYCLTKIGLIVDGSVSNFKLDQDGSTQIITDNYEEQAEKNIKYEVYRTIGPIKKSSFQNFDSTNYNPRVSSDKWEGFSTYQSYRVGIIDRYYFYLYLYSTENLENIGAISWSEEPPVLKDVQIKIQIGTAATNRATLTEGDNNDTHFSLEVLNRLDQPKHFDYYIKVDTKVKPYNSDLTLNSMECTGTLIFPWIYYLESNSNKMIPKSGAKIVYSSEADKNELSFPGVTLSESKGLEMRKGQISLFRQKDTLEGSQLLQITQNKIQFMFSDIEEYTLSGDSKIYQKNVSKDGYIGWDIDNDNDFPTSATPFKVTGLFAEGIADALYPIGTIYISANYTHHPALLFGGTWEQIKDVFLLGANDTNAGATGGSLKIAKENLPTDITGEILTNSNAGALGIIDSNNSGVFTPSEPTTNAAYATGTYPSGQGYRGLTFNLGGKGDPYYPPYLAVYIWQRIA